jgi:hypothetical protein
MEVVGTADIDASPRGERMGNSRINRAAGETEQVVRRNHQPLFRSSSAAWKYPFCELQPLGVQRLFAWAIALVVVQRGLHVVSDAKNATRCRGGTALYAFSFLSTTKLPFTLARYFQIRKFIYNASHSITSRLAVYEIERFVKFFHCFAGDNFCKRGCRGRGWHYY